MQTLTNSEVTFAGFWVRLAAFVIDSIVVGSGLFIVRLIMSIVMLLLKGTPLEGPLLFTYSLKDISIYVFEALYYILCTYFAGTTLGKRAMNLRVIYVGEQEEDALPFFNVVYRETVGKFLSRVILCIGFLIIAINKEKNGLHDILSDTRVIYAKKMKVYPVYPKVRPQPIIPVTVAVRDSGQVQNGATDTGDFIN